MWTVAAKKGDGVPWYQGVIRGAETFMAAWHKKEEKKSQDRAIDRDAHEQDSLETTTGQGRGVQGGEQWMGLQSNGCRRMQERDG